jgi:purine-nucleoside/S-methyl-5'-thioadenosine phosphorylase / adenosine deaminase
MIVTVSKKRRPESRIGQPHPPAKDGWDLRSAGRLQVLEAPALTRLNWLVHAFSTRCGGASQLRATNGAKTHEPLQPREAAGQVLNLGFTDGDTRRRVLSNRKQFLQAIGADEMSLVAIEQIHSDVVHRVTSATPATLKFAKGDALLTSVPGVLLAVQTADCVPILLADRKRRAVAAIHSGWRGTLLRIAAKALGRMRMEFGTSPQDVIAAIGPSIGRCCYEVGSEVAGAFHAQFPHAREWFDGPFDALAAGQNDPNWLPWLTMKPPGHQPPSPCVHLDLVAANCSILAEVGVPPAQISQSGLCTSCRTDLFFSYRRERVTGRLMAVIGIR